MRIGIIGGGPAGISMAQLLTERGHGDVTVLEQLRGDWLVAGIGLAADDDNYWALNLVAAPESQQRRFGAAPRSSVRTLAWLSTSRSSQKA